MTEANTLFLRLEGPLQAWGDTSKFVIRRTMDAPTKSGVLGLLCCAMGLSRQAARERLPELNGLAMGVRIDRPGTRWWDYHTVGAGIGILRADGKEIKRTASTGKIETLITRREYLADASFLVVLKGDAKLIHDIAAAIASPKWPVFLGRKSCPPSVPVLARPREGESWTNPAGHDGLNAALSAMPWRPRCRHDATPQDDTRTTLDPEFLAPYKPGDFPEQRHLADQKKHEVGHDALKQVHSPRNEEAGFLFRIDPLPNGRAVILVLSALEPDWEYAFHNAEYLLAAPPQRPRPLRVSIKPGERFGFRLVANPTKKILTIPKKRWDSMSQEERDKKITRHGKRVPVPSSREIDEWRAAHPGEDPRTFVHEKLIQWLSKWRPMQDGKPADSAGFAIDPKFTLVQPGYVYINKEGKGQGKRLRSARYDGTLTVTDPDAFRQTLICGIGPAKAFGFGLLSLARASQ